MNAIEHNHCHLLRGPFSFEWREKDEKNSSRHHCRRRCRQLNEVSIVFQYWNTTTAIVPRVWVYSCGFSDWRCASVCHFQLLCVAAQGWTPDRRSCTVSLIWIADTIKKISLRIQTNPPFFFFLLRFLFTSTSLAFCQRRSLSVAIALYTVQCTLCHKQHPNPVRRCI